MTTRRYANYRRALELIAAIGEPGSPDAPPKSLRELSEEFLLSRAASIADLEDETDDLATTLTHMTRAGMVGVETATRLWRIILACGPPDGVPSTDFPGHGRGGGSSRGAQAA